MRVTEGDVTLAVPDRDLDAAGPAERSSAFYNPAMATSRDVSVLVHDALATEVPTVLDGLAGAGARGLRIAQETDVERVTLNDQDPDAVEAIEAAVQAMELDGVEVTRRDLRDLLPQARWDAVDVDPYGSPAPWLEGAFEAVESGGIVAFAATDTATLHGRHPKALERRYRAEMVRQPAEKEIGQRVLVGAAARTARKLGRGVRPLVAFEDGHHFRVWLSVTDEPSPTGHAHRCPTCGETWLDGGRPCGCDVEPETSGPLWTGPLLDVDLLDALDVDRPSLARPDRTAKLVRRLGAEADAPPLFVDLHRLSKDVQAPKIPSFDALEDALREAGYGFCRTHYVETGLRTDAPRAELASIVQELV